MTKRGKPMLADFGLSRALTYSNVDLKTSSYGKLKGSYQWMAYELLAFIDGDDQEILCTKASDIWAYGMVLYVRSGAAVGVCD